MTVFFTQENNKKEEKKIKNKKNTDRNDKLNKIDNLLLSLTKVPLKEKLFFVQHLGVMLKAGVSISIALKTLSKQTENKRFEKTLKNIAKKVEKGETITNSLKPHKNIFGEMFINMIEAGELSGKLEDVLTELHTQMKKEHKLISKVKGALTYPTVIVLAMFGIGTFMLVVIIPQMTTIFEEMKVELPLPTKILISTSHAIRNNGFITVIVLISFLFSFIKIYKTKKGKFAIQTILLKLPVIGMISKKINLARFSRNISSLLKTDIMIVKSFEITANVLNNLHYRKAIQDISAQIKKGKKISEILEKYPKLFTPVVIQMVTIGEETGELDTVLIELAEFYEEEVDLVMENLPSIIEPLLILGMGVGVGGVAVAIIMPMYALSSAM